MRATTRVAPTWTVLILIFICVVFNHAHAQSTEKSEAAIQVGHRCVLYTDSLEMERISQDSQYDLVKYPIYKYEVDTTLISHVKIGDYLPLEIMEMPLRIVAKGTVSDTIKINDFDDEKLLVIDFWARWCSPCVESMEKWEGYVDEIGGDLVLLGVNIDYDYKAYPFINERGWNSSSVIGLNAFVLNRYFFDRPVVSRMAWIKDGKLIAITGTKGYDLQLVRDVIAGKDVDIPMQYEWTYSQPTS